jgi:hypothetical protein
MSDIQRWYITNPPGQPTEFVSYADHVAAVAEAEQRGRNETEAHIGNPVSYQMGYEQGQRDERAKAVAAVEALTTGGTATNVVYNAAIYHAIAAIKGDTDE